MLIRKLSIVTKSGLDNNYYYSYYYCVVYRFEQKNINCAKPWDNNTLTR